jgi:meiotically up-regulated gene 157 (Mug157) protein
MPPSAQYSFKRSSQEPIETLLHGVGAPAKPCGLSQSPFRPSDDAATFLFPIAANAMAMEWLNRLADSGLLEGRDGTWAHLQPLIRELTQQIGEGIERWGIIRHPIYGPIFAYEVDGRGSALLSDDANVPSLLSLPYLGYAPVLRPSSSKSSDSFPSSSLASTSALSSLIDQADVYRRTRAFLLSTDNPWFFNGTVAQGIGSPHGHGFNFIWPMSIIMQGLTSDDDNEILLVLTMLKTSHGRTGFMHESFNKDNATGFTRSWFAWANTLFGELIMKIAQERPHLIFK